MGASNPKQHSPGGGGTGNTVNRNAQNAPHRKVPYSIEDYSEYHEGVEVKIPFDGSMECMEMNEFPVVMKWRGSHAKRVSVSGSWDKWKTKIPLSRSQEDFATIINLKQGYHTYAYEVDGEWKCDEMVPKVTNEDFGGRSTNVLEVDRADYEVKNHMICKFYFILKS